MNFRLVLIVALCFGAVSLGLAREVSAAPSKSKVLTACKNKIYEVFGSDVRTKLHRYRRAGVIFRVKTTAKTHTVTCVFNDGRAELLEGGKPANE